MAFFLERIASHLLDEYGDRLEKQCLVFPNRRAGLYFLKYLSSKAGRPLWAPAVKTINELFTSSSSLQIAEAEILIFELYRAYRNLNPRAESFDEFYFWGEMIINDFDDVDKYLVDASRLFSNIADLKRIDETFGGLNEEQVNVIRKFWVNFKSGNETREKADFLEIWSLLPDLYRSFHQTLLEKNIAYEGMIFREVAEKCLTGHMPAIGWETLHFTGFNALNKCEKILLNTLKKENCAKFYWDYDLSYTQPGTDHSAGFFIRSNIREFGNDMPSDWNYSTFISSPPPGISRRIIDTPSDIAQVKLVPELIAGMSDIKGEEACHTAIVLADEALLVPLLSTIPDVVDDVNITMGYPLKFSPVYSLVRHLLSLQTSGKGEAGEDLFDHREVFSILRHSYFSEESVFHCNSLVSELIRENRQWIPASRFDGLYPFETIFKRVTHPSMLPSYLKKILQSVYITDDDEESKHAVSDSERMIHNEFIYRTLLVINRIEKVISESDVPLTTSTWARLLDKILKVISIPFAGEPLRGIQVMGILETRTLDFRNLIVLSANEGKLPKSSAGSSYIPYSLREAFGLPTIRHQDSIYAYYFYRLLHKAGNVTFVYNSNSEGLRTGEMSRFLLQLTYLDVNPPAVSGVSFNIATRSEKSSEIKRNEDHLQKLTGLFIAPGKKTLSPSAVNTWLRCSMKFYFRYVCGLEEPERIVTEIDPALFGGMLHGIMEKIYSPYRGKVLDRSEIEKIMRDAAGIRRVIDQVIAEKYHSGVQAGQGGTEQIIAGMLNSYAGLVLRKDLSEAPFTIMDLEKRVNSVMEITIGNRITEINTGGIIDRLDKKGGTLRVIDYKTGNVSMEIKSVESLFDETDDKRNESWFQILMYCEIISEKADGSRIRPSLYALRSLADPDSSDYLLIKPDKNRVDVMEDYSLIRDIFKKGLDETLAKIFSSELPFTMTEHVRKCEFCPYRKLCRR